MRVKNLDPFPAVAMLLCLVAGGSSQARRPALVHRDRPGHAHRREPVCAVGSRTAPQREGRVQASPQSVVLPRSGLSSRKKSKAACQLFKPVTPFQYIRSGG
jgi:hypothetical protein